ncbi:sulfatase-like hydrolase/transferase [Aliidiomarina quisquiliarum]|uniref:sulfatase-like hydrolase/transferase n=1 Tax=Aliidiomarina quisquiliarum TaxID=2938947 RepID=UPI00208E806C|nr:sulfatase-like hydrolase/transferase [Aliidiomarina quisquiliarum]MCO4321556.1 sulfatase-like hydrolase/transferase [Aliidiomarina quisquiliarum]
MMNMKLLILASLSGLLLSGCNWSSSSTPDTAVDPIEEDTQQELLPNILFIVVDDAGVDQFEAFGYGGAVPAATDNINAIAQAGVRFRNTWSMPTCSPTRTSYFDGRYPFRNQVYNAIVSNTLANSQMSPYRATVPKLLREHANYQSALIGKMHLTGSDLGPDNHPLGDSALHSLGWDYFAGYLDGAPYPVDSTAGGVAPQGTYQCGFVPNTKADAMAGADFGMCYLANGEHILMNDTALFPTPGRTCMEQGGIFDPKQTEYSVARHAELRFDNQNGFYTAEWKISRADGSTETLTAADPRGRGYRTTQEANRAIAWIKQAQQDTERPWMLTLGFAALHTPLQPPPAHLLPNPEAEESLLGCGTPVASALADVGVVDPTNVANAVQQRVIAQHMLEAVDHEIGRLLEETGIALRNSSGDLEYNPNSDTVIVFTTDNGTYMPSVKLPFDPLRAKGTLYQSGVWVPLIVTGPVVEAPNRDVGHMVNSTDLYRLFLDIAGIDTEQLATTMEIDAQPVMPYLSYVDQQPIRSTNFTELGTNSAREAAPPCVIPQANVCVQIFPQAQVCEDQGGNWYGPGSDANPQGFSSCCAVNDWLAAEGKAPTELFPTEQRAIRSAGHKLLRVSTLNCATNTLVSKEEFYEINESPYTSQLKLDRAESDLLALFAENQLTAVQQQQLSFLRNELDSLLATQVSCPGDGNGDLLVDNTDIEQWAYWSDPEQGGGLSSWYDLNHDGLTNELDKEIIMANLGNICE